MGHPERSRMAVEGAARGRYGPGAVRLQCERGRPVAPSPFDYARSARSAQGDIMALRGRAQARSRMSS